MLTGCNTGWGDFDDVYTTLDSLRHNVNRLFESGFDRGWPGGASSRAWPRSNVIDAGDSLIVTAEVPGLTDKDIEVTLNQDVLSLTGQRKVTVPEGYSAHRQERTPVAFARSFALPSRVDPEKVSARVKDGILTVKLEKATEARPRQIQINAA
jgi:HSP20 family protein